ncbi:MAG TPA: translation elongation factor Ts [Thermoleophilaceae bacterium]|nr:translation elongation factor Ts [Thermoleophilaceae bacterium]
MADFSAKDVKTLRDATGAGMMDCKRALEEAGGDFDKAVEILRVKGAAKSAKRGERGAGEGVVESYLHATGKIGVLVEVNCETDFVARTDDFRDFAREVALHIAAAGPEWVGVDQVPEDFIEAEKRVFEQEAADKPEQARPKIVEGKLRKRLEEMVLLNQAHVNTEKHDGRTIEELRAEVSQKTGENIVVRRFARFQVGA